LYNSTTYNLRIHSQQRNERHQSLGVTRKKQKKKKREKEAAASF